MESIRVASTTDVPAGKMIKVNINGRFILIANVDGSYYALNNKCPHLGGSLADGTLENGVVTCPRHGSQFEVRSGTAVGKAKLGPIKVMPHPAQKYEVRIEGTDLIVRIP